MVHSMTGFGRGVTTKENYQLTVEVRSVNHRFLEIHTKFPKEWMEAELIAKKIISEYVQRGKLDVAVNLKQMDQSVGKFHINWPLIESYKTMREQLIQMVPIPEQWSLQELFSLDQALKFEVQEIPVEELNEVVALTIREACEKLVHMRKVEGSQLKIVLLQYKDDLKEQIDIVRDKSPEAVKKYREKLIERINEIVQVDMFEDRILAEVALYAEKIDIAEELDRLESHIKQFEQTMNESKSVGRKLDFLMQEMLREVNTIGSKNQSSDVSVAVVQAKTIIEKMREQVQNIE